MKEKEVIKEQVEVKDIEKTVEPTLSTLIVYTTAVLYIGLVAIYYNIVTIEPGVNTDVTKTFDYSKIFPGYKLIKISQTFQALDAETAPANRLVADLRVTKIIDSGNELPTTINDLQNLVTANQADLH